MAKKFEVGDIVVCVDPGTHKLLEKEKIYKVDISGGNYIGLDGLNMYTYTKCW